MAHFVALLQVLGLSLTGSLGRHPISDSAGQRRDLTVRSITEDVTAVVKTPDQCFLLIS